MHCAQRAGAEGVDLDLPGDEQGPGVAPGPCVRPPEDWTRRRVPRLTLLVQQLVQQLAQDVEGCVPAVGVVSGD